MYGFWASNGGTGRRNLLESATAVNDNKWHYVVVVRDAGVSTKFYIDGFINQMQGTNNAGDLSNTDTFGIRKTRLHTTYGTYFNGFLDDVKIYPYARTAAQIKLLSLQRLRIGKRRVRQSWIKFKKQ